MKKPEISGCANNGTKVMANFWCEECKFVEVKQKRNNIFILEMAIKYITILGTI